MRIVHDTCALCEAARSKIVRETERVASLVSRELANAREDHLQHRVLRGIADRLAILIRSQQRLSDEIILLPAQRPEGDVPFDNLPGTSWSATGSSVAPPAGVAVDPLDHVVADIHGVGVGGQDIDAEGPLRPSRSLERLIPPARTIYESGANWLRRSTVHEVQDRRNRLAVALAASIFL